MATGLGTTAEPAGVVPLQKDGGREPFTYRVWQVPCRVRCWPD